MGCFRVFVVTLALLLDALGGFGALYHVARSDPPGDYAGSLGLICLSVPLWLLLPWMQRAIGKEQREEVEKQVREATFSAEEDHRRQMQAAASALDRIRLARSPGDRRYVLKRTLASLDDDEARRWLVSQAAQIDVAAAHDKAARLKSPDAKARVYQAAAQALRADDVPDEFQVEAIAELEAAAADLRAEGRRLLALPIGMRTSHPLEGAAHHVRPRELWPSAPPVQFLGVGVQRGDQAARDAEGHLHEFVVRRPCCLLLGRHEHDHSLTAGIHGSSCVAVRLY